MCLISCLPPLASHLLPSLHPWGLAGFLDQCMESLLFDQKFWINSLDRDNLGIDVSVPEDTLHLMFKGLLMQEGIGDQNSVAVPFRLQRFSKTPRVEFWIICSQPQHSVNTNSHGLSLSAHFTNQSFSYLKLNRGCVRNNNKNIQYSYVFLPAL